MGFLIIISSLLVSYSSQNVRALHDRDLHINNDFFQDETILWAKRYGSSAVDMANSMEPTVDGGNIVVGRTFVAGANNDIWALNLKSDGEIEWQKTYGGADYDEGYSIKQTKDEGFIVAGSTWSFGGGQSDLLVLKLYSNGEIEWQKTYGDKEKDVWFMCKVQETTDGGFILASSSSSFGAGDFDIWLLKLSKSGSIEWQKNYSGEIYEDVYSVLQTKDGGYIIAGMGMVIHDTDIWILKLTSSGDIEWQRTYATAYLEGAYAIIEADDGGYVIAGETSSFGAHTKPFGFYGWILKLSQDGDIKWQKIYKGSEPISFQDIEQTVDGGFVVCGNYGRSALSNHISHMLVLKLSSKGSIKWQKIYGSGSVDIAYSVYQTSDRGYFVSGFTGGRPLPGSKTDIMVLRLSENGDVGIGCYLAGIPDAVVEDTNIAPLETNIIPITTNVAPQSTNISPQDTDVKPVLLCWNLNQPPENISITKELNRSLFRKEIYHKLSWSQNVLNDRFVITEYKIYRSDSLRGYYQLIGTVPGNVFEYLDVTEEKYFYTITSVDAEGNESPKSQAVKS